MYKCIHAHNGDIIVLLSPNWRERLPELRRMDEHDELICQGCRQPVRVRAGKHRRWHFAHKHLKNCPFQQSSPELLAARAILYEWLTGFYGPQAVDVETLVPGINLPRPLDLWVNTPDARFAFWIIESRLQPLIRQQLKQGFQSLGIPVVVVFLASMLHPDPNREGAVYLTTTEREFASQTTLDILENVRRRPVGKSIHYLDADSLLVITIRDTYCIHTPQVFQGILRVDNLNQIRLKFPECELVHPGELERLEKLVSRQEHRQQKIAQSRQVLGGVLRRMLPEGELGGQTGPPIPVNLTPTRTPSSSSSINPDQIFSRLAVCLFCGRETEDWWYLDRATGKCKCRNCLKEGKS